MSESGFSVDDHGRFCYRPSDLPAILLMTGQDTNGYSFQIWRSGQILLTAHYKEKPWIGDIEHLGRIARGIAKLRDDIGFSPDMNNTEARDLLFRLISRFATEIVQWEEAHKEEAEVLPTPEDSDEAIKLLHDPEILCKILDALKTLGLVGESKNGLLTYLEHVSSMLGEPINERLSGVAGLGKTSIVVLVSKLWPPEKLIIRSGVTKKWIWYLSEAKQVDAVTRKLDLHAKVLIILEESESAEFLDEAKPLLSHDVPTLTYSFVDDKLTRQMVLEGWPAYIGVSVLPRQGEEHKRRALHVTPDRGQKKYSAVIKDDAKRHMEPWQVKQVKLAVFHEAVRHLKPVKIWVPWLDKVAATFPSNKAAFMSHWKQLRILLEAVVFLHQYQRNHLSKNGEEYVQAEPIDLEIALAVAENALSETLQSLPRDAKDFFDYLRDEVKKVTYTYRDLFGHHEECFGEPTSRTTLRDRFVDPLVDQGLMDKDESKKAHEFSIVAGKALAQPADLRNTLRAICSEETKAKIDRYYQVKVEEIEEDSSVSGRIMTEPLTLSGVAGLKKLLSRSKEEDYGEDASEKEFATCAINESQNKPKQPDFIWRRIPAAERCELCGQLAVEYEINDLRGYSVFRRCQVCFGKIKSQFDKAAWQEERGT